MENTRNLSNTDVSKEAIKSVESMVLELADSLVNDYIISLKQTGNTLSTGDIDRLTKYVIDNVNISMKIGLKVNNKIVDDLQISLINVNQAGFNEFEK